MQDRVKRTAVTREMGGMMGHYPSVANFPMNRIRRIGESTPLRHLLYDLPNTN